MIKSAHTIIVKFSPVTKDKDEFSYRILKLKGTSLWGGSYSSMPCVESYSDDILKAMEKEFLIKKIITEHGGTVIKD